MNIGLQITYLWHDVDVYEFDVFASNGMFSASAKPYVGIGGLAEAAAKVFV